MFRIQKKGSQIKEGLKPIILQHGLLDCSDTWIINDEDKAPAFMLANAGYDIWLTNSRGNNIQENMLNTILIRMQHFGNSHFNTWLIMICLPFLNTYTM